MKFLRSHYFLTLATGILLVLPQITFAAETIMDSLNESAQNLVFNIVMGILGMFVWFAALILNFAINSFVIGFGDAYVNTGIGLAVDNTWVIVRDFVNLSFIFGFVYIGFMMILKSSDSNTRRWLVNIILAALMVNFSLFIVKFSIDVSNQLAAQIAISGLGSTCADEAECLVHGLRQVDVATEFMARMGLSAVFALTWADIDGAGWGYIFGSALLALTAMFVFAAGGILLIIRFAVLNLFMVLSPIMFLSWIIPAMKDTMNRFWSMFIGRALFAPIYLLFIYFSLQIISGLQVSVGGNANGFGDPEWAGTFAADKVENGAAAGTLGTLPFFILACVFMAASVVMADKLGADGGGKAVAMGKAFKNRVQGVAARQTVGRAARGAGALASRAEGSLNNGLGRMAQGGAASRAAARFLDRTAGAGLRNTQNASVAGSESYNARNTRVGQQNARLNQAARESARARDFDINHGIGEDVDGVMTPEEREQAKNKMASVIRDMSDDELKSLSLEQLKSNTVAGHLSDAQIKMLAESGLHTNEDIKGLKKSRNNATFSDLEATLDGTGKEFASVEEEAEALEKAFEELGKKVKGMSEERLTGLGADKLKDQRYAAHLSDTQIESLQKSGKYSFAEIEEIKKARTSGIRSSAGINEDGQKAVFKGKRDGASANAGTKRAEKLFQGNPQDAGKLPPEMFMNEEMAKHITPQALEQRIRNGVTNDQAKEIKRVLERHISGLSSGDPVKNAWDSWDNRSINAARIDLDSRIFEV